MKSCNYLFPDISAWVSRGDAGNPLNFDDISELILNLLNTAINKNQLVKLKTNDIEKDPICDIVSWWAILLNNFNIRYKKINCLFAERRTNEDEIFARS